MRRLLPLAILAAALLAGCGAQGVTSPAPETVIGTLPKPASAGHPAFEAQGRPDRRARRSSRTPAASAATRSPRRKSTGTVGPNLDQAKPDYRLATARVTLGKGVMPSFKGQLSDQQIADVASYVVESTGAAPADRAPGRIPAASPPSRSTSTER